MPSGHCPLISNISYFRDKWSSRLKCSKYNLFEGCPRATTVHTILSIRHTFCICICQYFLDKSYQIVWQFKYDEHIIHIACEGFYYRYAQTQSWKFLVRYSVFLGPIFGSTVPTSFIIPQKVYRNNFFQILWYKKLCRKFSAKIRSKRHCNCKSWNYFKKCHCERIITSRCFVPCDFPLDSQCHMKCSKHT